ncbi:MAG: ABC transporter substrate-binding protein, partial [Cyanophyceae cyanobacterium]
MKRRQLLGNLALSASAATAAACTNGAGPASSTGEGSTTLPSVEWRMATSWPNSLDTIFGGAQEVSDREQALTRGKFKIITYAAGENVGGMEDIDAVQNGSVEC